MSKLAKISNWWFLPLLVIQGSVAFLFWMSPLGLGFHGPAVRKLNYVGVHEVFMVLFWAGPIAFLFFLAVIPALFLSKGTLSQLKKITLIGIIGIIALQISMLTYLSI